MKKEISSRKIESDYFEKVIFHPEFKAQPLKLHEIVFIILLPIITLAILIIGGRYGYFQELATILIILIVSLWIFLLVTNVIPHLLILFRITVRTKNKNFCLQFVAYTHYYVSLLGFGVGPFLANLNIINLLSLASLFIISTLVLLVEFKFIQQPLLLIFTDVSKRASKTRSTILSSVALTIDSIEDGYSQRALSLGLKALTNLVSSFEDFMDLGKVYIRFLANKGVIIDWEITDNAIKLYPRFLIPASSILTNWGRKWQLLVNLRKRKNLTKLEITYDPPQITIQVAPNDYEMLAKEITFHFLGLNVLNRVGQSLIAFVNDDREAAYNLLF
ncbi:MAG: hypothetical protein ACFFDT_19845 [Candidatus Hodarchaeota archaeon]